MSHTPGRWYQAGSEIYAEYNLDGGMTNRWIATVQAGRGDTLKQQDYDNLLVMAAAPDLLKAAKTAYDNLTLEYPSEHIVMKRLSAAIAKAEGREGK